MEKQIKVIVQTIGQKQLEKTALEKKIQSLDNTHSQKFLHYGHDLNLLKTNNKVDIL